MPLSSLPPRLFDLGDNLTYVRNVDGTTPVGEVQVIYVLSPHGHPLWPKPVCCRYVYRLKIPHLGDRTVCECRLFEPTVPT